MEKWREQTQFFVLVKSNNPIPPFLLRVLDLDPQLNRCAQMHVFFIAFGLILYFPIAENFMLSPGCHVRLRNHLSRYTVGSRVHQLNQRMAAGSLSNDDDWYDSDKVSTTSPSE